jgi:hypothetical protein
MCYGAAARVSLLVCRNPFERVCDVIPALLPALHIQRWFDLAGINPCRRTVDDPLLCDSADL